MRDLIIFSAILFLGIVFLSGCETTKGFSKGVTQGIGKGMVDTAVWTSEGAVEDSKDTYKFLSKSAESTYNFISNSAENTYNSANKAYNSLLKADKWIQENLW
ncbi:MAG: hypothetical protein ABH914_03275 [Candidatus Omnitrophota bacterium]